MRLGLLGLPLVVAACGYTYTASVWRAVAEPGLPTEVGDDQSITCTRGRLEVRLRPVSDEELNRQFGAVLPGGTESDNPYTFGSAIFWGETAPRPRFTVFRLSVKNYEFPKVRLAPGQVLLLARNGRRYWSLGFEQLDTYYRAYTRGYRGNEYSRYQERRDTLRRTLFRGDDVFSGQEAEGFLVFPALHADVSDLEVLLQGIVLRVDFRDEPTETMDLRYRFNRQTGQVPARVGAAGIGWGHSEFK
jgi:hypothetical protein